MDDELEKLAQAHAADIAAVAAAASPRRREKMIQHARASHAALQAALRAKLDEAAASGADVSALKSYLDAVGAMWAP